ncbi:MAG: acyltransferase [Verrucomicrobiota bacterium]
MRTAAKNLNHFDFIDILRGVAIVLVLLCHTLGTVYGYGLIPWDGWLLDLSGFSLASYLLLPLSFGNAGVAIFFVISGFCIHLSFHQQGKNWGEFFIRRFFRIYPAYLAALVFFTVFIYARFLPWAVLSREFWIQFLSHAFLVHNFHPSTISGLNGAFWSLALEAQLYACYPALLWLVAKAGWQRSMAVLGLCQIAIQGSDSAFQMANATQTLGGQVSWFLCNSVLGYWFSWALGAWLAEAFLGKRTLPQFGSSWVWWLGMTIASHFIKPLLNFQFLFASLFAAAIIGKHFSSDRRRPLNNPAARAFKNIGLWSYSLYLLHLPLLSCYHNTLDSLLPSGWHLTPPLEFCLTLLTWLAILPFSFAWYRTFELPAIGWGKRLGAKLEKPAAANAKNNQGSITPATGRPWPLIVTVGVWAVISIALNARFEPLNYVENNDLAWSFATNPDASRRNASLAVKHAEIAVVQTGTNVTVTVGTLAAAYAEAGMFDKAIEFGQRACDLASRHGETNLLEINQKLLLYYQNHQPFHMGEELIRK